MARGTACGRTGGRLGLVGTAAALVATGMAAPASAAQLEHFRVDDDRVEIREDQCGVVGLDVEWHRVERGVVVVTARGKDGIPHLSGSFQGSATYTNLATGKDLTFRWRSIDKDLHVIDNGDGTSTAVNQRSGDRTWWSGGRRIAADTGTVRYDVLLDNGGTPTDTSDDEVISVGTVQPSTGRNPDGFDFCTALIEYTT